jgi:hypothetical protein
MSQDLVDKALMMIPSGLFWFYGLIVTRQKGYQLRKDADMHLIIMNF